MQLVPRYLVNNRTVVVLDEAGFTVEFRPVYQRNLYVYKGIDNVLQFQVKNADQKPVNITSYTPRFVAFDENSNQVLDINGVLLDDDSSATRGTFKVIIPENNLLNLKQQYLTYNIYMEDADNEKVLTYANEWFDATGVIYLSSRAFPGPRATGEINTFSKVSPSLDEWTSESLDAQPGINGNEALHTVAVYTSEYTGDVVVQGTLENQVTPNTVWADLTTLTAANETAPIYANFNGVFSYLRVKTTVDPADKITKILVRN